MQLCLALSRGDFLVLRGTSTTPKRKSSHATRLSFALWVKEDGNTECCIVGYVKLKRILPPLMIETSTNNSTEITIWKEATQYSGRFCITTRYFKSYVEVWTYNCILGSTAVMYYYTPFARGSEWEYWTLPVSGRILAGNKYMMMKYGITFQPI